MLDHDSVRDILVNGKSFELELSSVETDKVVILLQEDDEKADIEFVDDGGTVRVASISPNCQFADLHLTKGDEIAYVNHHDVRGMSALQVSTILRQIPEIILLHVITNDNPLPESSSSA